MPRVVADEDKKKARMEMRITEEDRDIFAQAAKIAGANDSSEWARAALRVLAWKLIEDHEARKKKKR